MTGPSVVCVCQQEQRKHAISNAKKQWEVTQGGVLVTDKHAVKSQPELYTTHAASFTSCSTERENGLEDNDSSRARFVFLQVFVRPLFTVH